MISNVGIDNVTDYLINNFNYIAIGTSNQIESQNDDTLISEINRELGTSSITTISRPNDTIVLYKRFSDNSPVSFKETGLFNNIVNGTMFSRSVIPNILSNQGEFVDVYYRVQVSDKND
jgi:hypothetical protein